MDQKQFLNNMFEPFFHTHQAMDDRMVGIMRRREEYEKVLGFAMKMFGSICCPVMAEVPGEPTTTTYTVYIRVRI